ncbi:uncharacterized protein LOC132500867 isoform X2 [Mesoplodon densirostris]|uniref:uncharacterized protein LOC132500867 isoform X2 n=1 Tax=Mesoplodon densirostris TaxID=48708 RepID=UPI0028DD032B|nr:uncharacterized protein LOC132500867 isoform X2 [Mesoplodon densirostris]
MAGSSPAAGPQGLLTFGGVAVHFTQEEGARLGSIQSRDAGHLQEPGLPGSSRIQTRSDLPAGARKGALGLGPAGGPGRRDHRRPQHRFQPGVFA